MAVAAAKKPAAKTRAKASAKKTAVKKPRIKKRYLDGNLEFKSKAMLDYHLELKSLHEEGLIQSFSVPTISTVDETKNKFKAVKCEIDGHTFDSLMESRYYIHLLKEKEAGNVISFELQPPFVLQESFRKNGKAVRKIEYKADFRVIDKNNDITIYDVKGDITKDFALKRKMFDFKFRDLTLKCVQYVAKTKSWIEV